MKADQLQPWATPAAVITAGLLIAASILFMGRWEISATGYGFSSGPADNPTDSTDETVFRLDRWTGEIQECTLDVASAKERGEMTYRCPATIPVSNQ